MIAFSIMEGPVNPCQACDTRVGDVVRFRFGANGLALSEVILCLGCLEDFGVAIWDVHKDLKRPRRPAKF